MIHIEQFKGENENEGYENVAKLVMVDNTISIGAKALYSYLCSYAFGKDEAYPTVERIMQELNISENSFRRYRKELKIWQEPGFAVLIASTLILVGYLIGAFV